MSLRLALRPLAVCSALCFFATRASAQNKVAVVSLQQAVLGTADIKAKSAAMEAPLRGGPAISQAASQGLGSVRPGLNDNRATGRLGGLDDDRAAGRLRRLDHNRRRLSRRGDDRGCGVQRASCER